MREKIQNDIKLGEAKEKNFKLSIEQKWNCKLEKLPIVYSFDYAIIKNGEIKGFVELKKREFKTTHFNDSMINLNKWIKGKELRDSTGLPTILICRYIDKDIYCILEETTKRKLKWGARTTKTRDWQDIQPAVHIYINQFKDLV